jgi:hypothetical protein
MLGIKNSSRENKRWVQIKWIEDVGCESPIYCRSSLKTNAADASIFIIFGNLDPSKGYKGITCFLAEKEWGVQIAKKEKKVCYLFGLICIAWHPSIVDMLTPSRRPSHTQGKSSGRRRPGIQVRNRGPE